MRRLTITYRALRQRAEGGQVVVIESMPGRVTDLEVTAVHTRDGALFYRLTTEESGFHEVPLDLLYHVAWAELPSP